MERIVVGVDASPGAQAALAWAHRQAARTGASLEVVTAYIGPWHPHAATDELTAMEPAHAEARREARAVLARAEQQLAELGEEVSHEAILVDDAPAPALLQRASGAELLVVGSRGRGGFAGLLLGSVSQQCVQHAPCPVVVVPTPARED
jgi:nucleotide-binding universal stress UspA family protein